MTKVKHITDMHVFRDPTTLFSITYDPKQIDSTDSRSYEGCMRRVEEAYREKIISPKGRRQFEEEITQYRMMYKSFRRLTDRDDLP